MSGQLLWPGRVNLRLCRGRHVRLAPVLSQDRRVFTAGWQRRHRRDDLKRVRVAVVVLALLVPVMAVLWVLSYVENAPLRGDGLRSAQAVVVDYDRDRRGADDLTVRYEVPGAGTQTSTVPVGSRYAEGERVEVLYVPDEPGKARTARDWEPVSQPAGLVYVAVPMVALGFSLWRLRTLRRRAAA